MREKSFFHAVARKIAKPNILVLFNRWDCSDGEADIQSVKGESYWEPFVYPLEDFIIKHLSKTITFTEQHLERAAEFLANEIKVVQNIDEGKRLVFFVSAKEMLNNTVNPERADSWSQFCDFIELCLNTTEQGCRYVHLGI